MGERRTRAWEQLARENRIAAIGLTVAIFLATATAVATVVGAIKDIQDFVKEVGLIGLAAVVSTVVLTAALFFVVRHRAKAQYIRAGRIRGRMRVGLVALSILLVASLFWSGKVLVDFYAPPAPERSPEVDSPLAGPATCSYLDKRDGSPEDLDIGVSIDPGGSVIQGFTASTETVGAVAAIMSRERRTRADVFSDDAIGRVRLKLIKIDGGGQKLDEVPIAFEEAGGATDANGVVNSEVKNNVDTVFRIRSESLDVGARYAVVFTNETEKSALGFSLRTKGNGDPVTLLGETRRGDRTLNYRALAGYVCDKVP